MNTFNNKKINYKNRSYSRSKEWSDGILTQIKNKFQI